MEEIVVKEVKLEDAFKVHSDIEEFKEANDTIDLFEDRIKGKDNVILVAYYNDNPAGYMISYDRYGDGSIYCWMAATKSEYRRHGILKNLMNYQMKLAKESGYNKVKIKTQNDRREMLSYLVKNGWNFTDVKEKDDIMRNKISLEINI